MTLGERIRTCRQRAGLSQEKVAELVGVSRQAVTKWESDQSAPNTENLFRLAELFGTTVDLLLDSGDSGKQSTAEQIYSLYKMEEEKKRARRKERRKKNILAALLIALGYMGIYLAGRVIWCDFADSSFVGWLALARPSGAHSYLYGWLLSSKMFWYAMAISVIPAIFGKRRFSLTTLAAFVGGLLLGMIFGPNPGGAATGQTHFGWAIWGVIYLLSIAVGILAERMAKEDRQ